MFKLYAISFVTAGVTMLAIDAVWLTVMSSRFYKPRIGHLMAESPNLAAVGVFYIIYITGLVVLVIHPLLASNAGMGKVLLMGALYGLVAYATYDLTNQATLRDWPTVVTVVDLVWGATLTAVVTLAAVSVTRYFS